MTADIPWKLLDTDFGKVPFYIVEFDERGACSSPESLGRLVEDSKSRSDVFLFSHGWNNPWKAATSRYDRFVDQFIPVRRAHWAVPDRPFAPILAGVVWPSAALVAPWERGPDIAADDPLAEDIAALGEALEPAQRARLREILADPASGEAEASEAAAMIASILGEGDEELGEEPARVDGDDLLEMWKTVRIPAERQAEPGGFIDEDADATAPQPAGFNPLGWIRDGIRLATVQLMKDRAGRVGGTGVAVMLRALADASEARISLVGHSYGAKVVLSALCNGPAPSRAVDSVLLLQPALSCYAFTDDLNGRRGGYRSALDRVRQPIITTWSAQDVPLTKFFHLAVRRKSDLAEALIAGRPPSTFAALGGYGPQDVPGGSEWIDMPAVGEAYPLSTPHRMIAVNGTRYITAHGTVETPETAWALLSQVRG